MIKIHYGQSPLLFINFIILFYSLGVYMMMKTPEISTNLYVSMSQTIGIRRSTSGHGSVMSFLRTSNSK